MFCFMFLFDWLKLLFNLRACFNVFLVLLLVSWYNTCVKMQLPPHLDNFTSHLQAMCLIFLLQRHCVYIRKMGIKNETMANNVLWLLCLVLSPDSVEQFMLKNTWWFLQPLFKFASSVTSADQALFIAFSPLSFFCGCGESVVDPIAPESPKLWTLNDLTALNLHHHLLIHTSLVLRFPSEGGHWDSDCVGDGEPGCDCMCMPVEGALEPQQRVGPCLARPTASSCCINKSTDCHSSAPPVKQREGERERGGGRKEDEKLSQTKFWNCFVSWWKPWLMNVVDLRNLPRRAWIV